MVELANTHHLLTELNKRSLTNKKVEAVHQDAFRFLEESDGFYDVILVDLPDPNNESLNKLYTMEFYSLLRNHLTPGGAIMVQATSPVFAPQVYWTIDRTIQAAGLSTNNLHVDVPSFGGWGFVLASRHPISLKDLQIKAETRYLTTELLPALARFGKDEDAKIEDESGHPVELRPNTLIRPNLIEVYGKSWKYY